MAAITTPTSLRLGVDPYQAKLDQLPTIDSRAFRHGRNLVLSTIVVLVVNRFFTETFPFLPKLFNFVDVPILCALAAFAALGVPRRAPAGFRPAFGPGMVAFAAICALSALLNLSRVDGMPALMFAYCYLGPLVTYAVTYRIWPVGQALSLSRTIAMLGVVQFLVVGLVNLPRFLPTGNPDYMSGTFGENAYQLVFFLLVFGSLAAGAATFEPGRLLSRLALPALGATFTVIFLAQYRTLLVTTALTVALTSALIAKGRGRGAVLAGTGVLAVAAGFVIVISSFPFLRFDAAVGALRDSPGTLLAGKVEAAQNVGRMYAENPMFLLIGSGPGTYSSRAWRTFALRFTVGSHSDSAGVYVSALNDGRGYRTDVSERYVVPQVDSRADILGSRVLASPYSSYFSLFAEVGLAGGLIIVVIYATVFAGTFRRTLRVINMRRRGDPLPALLIATTASLFVILQAGFFDNWLETARITMPVWIMVAITTKEYQARKLLALAEARARRAQVEEEAPPLPG